MASFVICVLRPCVELRLSVLFLFGLFFGKKGERGKVFKDSIKSCNIQASPYFCATTEKMIFSNF